MNVYCVVFKELTGNTSDGKKISDAVFKFISQGVPENAELLMFWDTTEIDDVLGNDLDLPAFKDLDNEVVEVNKLNWNKVSDGSINYTLKYSCKSVIYKCITASIENKFLLAHPVGGMIFTYSPSENEHLCLVQ